MVKETASCVRRSGRPPRAGWKPFTGARPRPGRSDFFSDGSPGRIGGGPGALVPMPRAGGRGADRRLDPPSGGRPPSSPGAAAVIDWRCGPGAVGGDEGVVMASKDNLHRETLRAALRIIQTAETLEEARIQLARMLNVFDKLEAKGLKGDAAVAEAEERLMITQVPKASAADERPVRRRELEESSGP